jgi:hypothetical protein
VYPKGVVVLAVVAVALLAITGGTVNAVVPLYATSGFTMAGLRMRRYHQRKREYRWRLKLAGSAGAGVLSARLRRRSSARRARTARSPCQRTRSRRSGPGR